MCSKKKPTAACVPLWKISMPVSILRVQRNPAQRNLFNLLTWTFPNLFDPSYLVRSMLYFGRERENWPRANELVSHTSAKGGLNRAEGLNVIHRLGKTFSISG